MRARITRDVPTGHSSFDTAPTNRAQREAFDQVTMTQALRSELDVMGYSPFSIEESRRLGSGEPKQYQFDVKLVGDAAAFDVSSVGGTLFDPLFNTTYEIVEDGAEFADPDAEPEEDEPHSAVAAVGAIIAGEEDDAS